MDCYLSGVRRLFRWVRFQRSVAKPCTCHPDDNPPHPCAQKYALSECRAAAAEQR